MGRKSCHFFPVITKRPEHCQAQRIPEKTKEMEGGSEALLATQKDGRIYPELTEAFQPVPIAVDVLEYPDQGKFAPLSANWRYLSRRYMRMF